MKCCILLSIALLTACSTLPNGPERITLTDGKNEVMVNVEIADEPEEYAQGLMERKRLPERKGMLFMFDDEAPRAFRMKNTLIPLDILFFDASGRFVNSQTMTPCVADPCPRYPSGKPAMYALEVGAGLVQQHRIGEGWILEIR